MDVDGKHFRTIWHDPEDLAAFYIIDQTLLPDEFKIERVTSVEQTWHAIKNFHVRGAGLIGATAGWGMYLATQEAVQSEDFWGVLKEKAEYLKSARPTAVNLEWAVDRQMDAMRSGGDITTLIAWNTAIAIADEDADYCRRIGEHGVQLIADIHDFNNGGGRPEEPVNILTVCNAGWLAFVDYGSATAPIYEAHRQGIPVHVWVSATGPWFQGSKLTAWELEKAGVPHTVISDNAYATLMQQGKVDMFISGTDRTTWTGDVANKIGTLPRAICADAHGIPFYVALPSSTLDFRMDDGVKEIPIEDRPGEVMNVVGYDEDGVRREVRIGHAPSPSINPVFDVTRREFVTGLITEKGIIRAPYQQNVAAMYPERVEEVGK